MTIGIIGAGQSGLSVGLRLKDIEADFRILDAGPSFGGGWRSRRSQLKLNTCSSYNTLARRPRKREVPVFETAETFLQYLETIGAELRKETIFDTNVNHVTRWKEKWVVCSASEEHYFDQLVISTGVDRSPNVPMEVFRLFPTASVSHSSQWFEAATEVSGRVLVVGVGNSGFEVLKDLSHLSDVIVDVVGKWRPNVLPLNLDGKPMCQHMASLLELKHEDAEKHLAGMSRKHTMEVARKFPDVRSTEILSGLYRFGIVPIYSDVFSEIIEGTVVRRFCSIQAAATNGTKYDHVICATGYEPKLSEILGNDPSIGWRGFPVKTSIGSGYMRQGLWFNGFRPSLLGSIYAADQWGEKISMSMVRH